MNSTIKYGVMGVAALFCLILVSCGMTTVDTGHRGVRITFGKVEGVSLPEGLYFANPFTTHIKSIDTRIQKWEDKTEAYTRDVQKADVNFVVNYRLDPTKAQDVYQAVGDDWEAKLIGQIVIEEIKDKLGQEEAVTLIGHRNQVATAIQRDATIRLAQRDVIMSGFQLTNIAYTHEFEHAVEEKVIAQQKAIEQQNHTVEIQEVANQQVLKAKSNAESTVLNAKAEAESIQIRAHALEANPKLVEWEAVQKWNGEMPQYMMGGNAVPFIQLPTANK